MKDELFLKNYLLQIKDKKCETIEIEKVLNQNQIPKKNVYIVNASVLFVDIRNSSQIIKIIKRKNMTKLYQMFATVSAMAVNESNGMIFQFAGDGFMAAFHQSRDSNAATNAYNACKRIKELLDNVYRAITDIEWHFDCKYAISSGHIYMTR